MRRLRWQVKLAASFLPLLLLIPLVSSGERKETDAVPAAAVSSETASAEPSASPAADPKTLKEWRSVNPNVHWLLHFEAEGRTLPVLSGGDDAYLMKHDPFGRRDDMGSIFTDPAGYQPDNMVIYGHSSKRRDEQFTFLKKYAESSYFDAYPALFLENEEGMQEYGVISFGLYDLNDENTYVMWANQWFDDAEDVKEMFSQTVPYLLQKREGAVYNGQHILTLVTCDMQEKDSRYVLQALEKEAQ